MQCARSREVTHCHRTLRIRHPPPAAAPGPTLAQTPYLSPQANKSELQNLRIKTNLCLLSGASLANGVRRFRQAAWNYYLLFSFNHQ